MQTKNYSFKRLIVAGSVLLLPLFKQPGAQLAAQAPNTWTQKANFGSTARDGAFAFAIGTKGYIGGGNNNGNLKNDIWEYNPTTNAWTQKNNIPNAEYSATSFVVGSKGYVGCGYNTANAFYEFDPVANTWTSKAAMPGNVRYAAMGFSIGTKGYCGTGLDASSYLGLSDFYEFDPVANTWAVKASVPGAGGRSYAISFAVGSKGYTGCGIVNSYAVNDFYEYDPTGNTWATKTAIGSVGRIQSFGISMNGKGYVGGGNNGSDNNGFYEYDPTGNTWTPKATTPFMRYGQVGFSIGSKLYVGTGGNPNNGAYANDFYEWNSCGPVISVSPSSAFLCGSGTVTLTASGANTYTWSNGTANGGVFSPSVTTRYTVTGALTGTCSSTNSVAVTVVVSTPAANQTLAPAASSFACNGNTNINLTTENGVNYYLRNDANNTILAGPFTGTGSTLNINTGNIAATTTLNVNARRASGGLTFDGVDDDVRTAGSPFNFSGDFTAETWITAPVGSNGGTSVIIGLPGGPDFWLGLVNGGYPNFTINGGTTTGTVNVIDGKWHHLSAVRVSGNEYLYVDGILAASGSDASALAPGGDLEIGAYSGSYNFLGQLDEVKIYSVALTQPQVAASMTSCATGSETGLLLYYNFEDGAGSSMATDIAGMDNNGSLTNMNTTNAWSYGVENCIACAATQMTTKPVITINAITNQTVTAVNPNICVSGNGTITTPGSDLNIDYFLRDNSNNSVVNGPVEGNGSALSFTTGVISATKTYNVFAKSQSAYLDFDGVDDYVSATSTVGIPSGNSPYTIEALIKPGSNNLGTFATWGNYGTNNDAVGFRLNGNGQLDNYWWNNDLIVNAGNLSDGSWHHVAATYDGSTRSIYVDGVLVGSDNPGTRNTTATNNLTIGTRLSSGNPADIYAGSMDEVRIWNIARTQADLQANMNSSLLGSESGLSVYYKFTDGTNSPTAKDLAGGDNTGTLTNMNTATAWKYYSTPCSLQMSNTPTVTINALPAVTVNNGTICSGNSATLIPSGASTYTITGGTFTVNPTANTSYSVTGTSSVGCVSSNTAIASVSVNTTPTVAVNSATICSGNSVTITPAGANTYTITGGTYTVTPSTTAFYSVTGTATNGCISNTAVATVSVNTTPTLSVNNATICTGNSFTIIPSGAGTYTITGGTFTVSPIANTSYSVTGKGVNGCAAGNTVVSTVSVNTTPTLAVNSATICSGNSVAIVPTGAGTYTITGNAFTVTPAATTSFSVTGTGANGCVAGNTVVSTVSVNTTPTLAVNSATICSGNSVVIVPTGAGTYTITGNTYTVTPATTTSYSVTGTGSTGCAAGNTVVSTVLVNTTPTLTVNSATLCSGSSVAIVPAGAGTYTITGNTYTVTPATTTSYSVTGTGTNGCAAGNTVVSTVSVNTTPTVMVNSTTICSGASVTLSPVGANTYTVTGGTFTVTPSVTASYSVTGTATNGCVSLNAVSTVSVKITPTLTVNSATICSGSSVVIAPTGAGTYTITGNSFTVSPATTTSYSVTGTATNGCAAGNTVVSTVSVNITPTVTANSATICSGNAVAIVPGGAGTYTITGGNFTVSPNTTTSYSVTGASAAGCVSSNSAVASVSVNATPTLSVNSTTICSGNSVIIVPTGANTYTITGNSYTVTPLATALYSVTGTGINGCVTPFAIVSTVSVNATPTISVNNATVCAGNSVAIVPAGANTYTITGNNFTVTPLTTASYSVTGTSTNGCTSSNVTVAGIFVNALPTITVNNATVCAGNSVAIVPTGAAAYTISGGSFTVTPAGTNSYSVSGMDLNGCVSAQTISTVTVNALPVVTATTSHSIICISETATLTAGGALTYSWSASHTGSVITVTPTAAGSQTYAVSGTNANGCVNTATVIQLADNCTAIKTIAAEAAIFGVYPNPNTGNFTVETNENVKVTVLNSLGQLVHSETTTGTKTNISLNHLANGIYFVTVTANGNKQTVKLIKE